MTVIVSIKTNDGIVLASDSASTFATGQVYLHADKIVNLVKGLPIGAMVTGAGGIGNESITTLLKDLRRRFQGTESAWRLDSNYTLQQVATRLRAFLYEEKALPSSSETSMLIRIAGYSAGKSLSEVWDVVIVGKECADPSQVQSETDFGPRWQGEMEALNRLILGYGMGILDAATDLNIPAERLAEVTTKIASRCYQNLCLPAMPIQDAIDLARYMVEATIGYERFSIFKQPKSVGGAVEIAAITKHEGFRWIQRKHFYQQSLNPPFGEGTVNLASNNQSREAFVVSSAKSPKSKKKKKG